MANEPEKVEQPDTSGSVDRYPPADWPERALEVSSSRHVIAGALHGADPKKKLSAADVRRKIDGFLAREVEVKA